MKNNILDKLHIRGTIALIVIVYGLYIIQDSDTHENIKMAVAGFIGVVLGYYFVSKETTKPKE